MFIHKWSTTYLTYLGDGLPECNLQPHRGRQSGIGSVVASGVFRSLGKDERYRSVIWIIQCMRVMDHDMTLTPLGKAFIPDFELEADDHGWLDGT